MRTRVLGSALDMGNLLAWFILLAIGSSFVLPCKANENVQIAAKTALTNLTTRSLGKLYKVRDQTETSEERETVLKACVAGLHAIGDTKNAAKVAGELDGDDFLFTFTTECSGCNGEGSTQTPCSKCKGTGRCQNRKCEEGMVTRSGFDGRSTTRKCPVCGGTAQCRSCNGTGSASFTCQKCRGAKLVVKKEKAKASCRELLKNLSNPSLGGGKDEQQDEGGADVSEVSKNKEEKSQEARGQEDANAMYNRGKCYANGDGVQKDLVEAKKWYRKAAERGHAEAQYMLGRCCASDDEAVKWYRKAADQGHAGAQDMLGGCYAIGLCGAQKDPVEAVKWWRKAAAQGHAWAQRRLGCCYLFGDDFYPGHGIQKDSIKAGKWLRKAAEQGDEEAQHIIDSIHFQKL